VYIKYTENYREGQPQKNFNQFRLFDLRDIFIDNDDNWTEEMTVAVIGKSVLPRDGVNRTRTSTKSKGPTPGEVSPLKSSINRVFH
jgi:hypothetical protein